MTRHKKHPLPLRAGSAAVPPSPCGGGDGGGVNSCHPDARLTHHTLRPDAPPPLPAPNHPLHCDAGEGWGGGAKTRAATTALALAFLALALPAHGKSCGTVVYKGKKTNIACSVALPNGKAKTPPPKPANTLIPPIQLPGDPPPAPVAPAAAPATAEPDATGQC